MKLSYTRLAFIISGGLAFAIFYPNSIVGDLYESGLQALLWYWINVPQRMFLYFSGLLHSQLLGGLVAFIGCWIATYVALKAAKTVALFMIGFFHGFFDELNKILDQR